MAKAKSVNERVLAMVNVDYDHQSLAWFKPYIDRWSNLYPSPGSVPTPAMLFTAACTGPRGAGKQTAAVAMALRPEGYTVGQLRMGFDSGPAHNHTDTLVDVNRKGLPQGGGIFSRTKTGSGQGNEQQFTLTFTPAGEKWLADQLVKRGLKKAPKPVNLKPKANKAKAPVDVTEAPVTEAPVEHVTPEQFQALAAQFNS